MNPKWKLPLIILLLLLVAFALRWDTKATKTHDQGVAKWVTDRWTGDTWQLSYKSKGVYEFLANRNRKESQAETDAAYRKRTTATIIWIVLFSLILGWLFYTVVKKGKSTST